MTLSFLFLSCYANRARRDDFVVDMYNNRGFPRVGDINTSVFKR